MTQEKTAHCDINFLAVDVFTELTRRDLRRRKLKACARYKILCPRLFILSSRKESYSNLQQGEVEDIIAMMVLSSLSETEEAKS